MTQYPQNSWQPFFHQTQEEGILHNVSGILQHAMDEEKVIYPNSKDVFRAFELCDFTELKVVILGQDPYHGDGEANGLCFSVHEGIRIPPSLKNIFKELKNEYPDFNLSRSSDLSDWARQGVLLINAVLTVEKDKPASHSGYGWQAFTDRVIAEISENKDFVVFILLGNFAKSKIPMIDAKKHAILTAAHPSPFSAYKGFFGSNVFVDCNLQLAEHGISLIQW